MVGIGKQICPSRAEIGYEGIMKDHDGVGFKEKGRECAMIAKMVPEVGDDHIVFVMNPGRFHRGEKTYGKGGVERRKL